MPRPGPRPYECIRRAWHSDSHQPLRGALIQEIFRVVNELHSTSTRRKKEWQEKLPIVVLRAEEILYSKANSESEYAGIETLRTRLDDAVNTMIRRDDSEEEGIYLAPCVEAALSLGCTPKKIPRGQRQVASRLLSNAARRNSIVCANNNINYRGVPGKGKNEVASVHDQSSNPSSCVVGAQHAQMQDQGFSTALPMGNPTLYSKAGCPPGRLACYTPGSGFAFPQNFPLPTTFEASHPSITPSLPQLGGLVQFLKSADPNAQTGLLSPVPFPMQMNVNHNTGCIDALSNARAQMDARFVCRDLNGSVCTASTISSPASSMSRSTMEIGTDGCKEYGQLVKNTLAGAVAMSTDIPSQKSLILLDTRMTPQMQEIVVRPDIFSKNAQMRGIAAEPGISSTHTRMQENAAGPDIFSKSTQVQGIAAEPDISSTHTQMQGFLIEQNRWQTCPVPKFGMFPSPPSAYRASPMQKGSATSPMFSIDVGASSHAGGDDLQLRLGPPGNEANSMPALTGDPSAPKRSRVDLRKLDVSASSIEGQLQLCSLPLPQQLSWPRC